ncbi:MAG: amidohydrolase family protein [Chloroflexota bacterium]
MIETAHLPVVDVHSHPFKDVGTYGVDPYVDTIAFPGAGVDFLVEGGVDSAAARELVNNVRHHTVYFRYFVREMAAFLGCAPSIEAVVAARNERAKAFRQFTADLYQRCNLTAMIADFGYPKPPLDVAKFKRETPIEVVPLYRIETFIDEWTTKDVSWTEFSRAFEETLVGGLSSGTYRGLKSVIAYRTGLDVSPLSRPDDHGLAAWSDIRRGIGEHKKLRDHLLCRALEICTAYDVPMQIHTGMGDYEVNLIGCRPALLMNLLRYPAFRACRVLLVHTGYPYHAEAGYMANMLPNVYCDVSEGIPFAGQAAERIYREVLEMAPLTKVCYGADGYVAPEIAYVGAILGKKALAQALEGLVSDGFLSQAEAQESAGWILAENARRLYQLD